MKKNKKKNLNIKLLITFIIICLLVAIIIPIDSRAEIVRRAWLDGSVDYEDTVTGEILQENEVHESKNKPGVYHRNDDSFCGCGTTPKPDPNPDPGEEDPYDDGLPNIVWERGSGNNKYYIDPNRGDILYRDEVHRSPNGIWHRNDKRCDCDDEPDYPDPDYPDPDEPDPDEPGKTYEEWKKEWEDAWQTNTGTTNWEEKAKEKWMDKCTEEFKRKWGSNWKEQWDTEWDREVNGEIKGNFTFRKDGKDFTTTSLWTTYKERGGKNVKIIDGPTFCVNIDKRLVDTRYVETVFDSGNARHITWNNNQEYIVKNQDIAYILAFAPGDSISDKMGKIQAAIWGSGFKDGNSEFEGKSMEEIVNLVMEQKLLENEVEDPDTDEGKSKIYDEILIKKDGVETDIDEDEKYTVTYTQEEYEDRIRSYFDEDLVKDAGNYRDFNRDKDDNNDGVIDFKAEDKTIYPNSDEGKNNSNALRVMVDQDTKKFTIGKFNIKYTEFSKENEDAKTLNHDMDKDNTKDETKKFSYISKLTLMANYLDENGNKKEKEIEDYKIISALGEVISERRPNTDKGETTAYKYPHSEEEFYIEFTVDPNDPNNPNYNCQITSVYLKIEFKYLAQCYAEFTVWGNAGATLKEKGVSVRKKEDYVEINGVVYIRYKQEDGWGEWMAKNGCGATTLATIASAYTGRRIEPDEVQRKTQQGLGIDVMMKALSSILGDTSEYVTFEDVPYKQVEGSEAPLVRLKNAVEDIQTSLEEGRPVLTLIAPNNGNDGADAQLFCDKIHYVTLLGFDENGNLLLANPKGGKAEDYSIEFSGNEDQDDEDQEDENESPIREHAKKVLEDFVWHYMMVDGGATYPARFGPRGYSRMKYAPSGGKIEATEVENIDEQDIQPLMQTSTEISDEGKEHIREIIHDDLEYGNTQLAYPIWKKAEVELKRTQDINVRMDIGGIVFMDRPDGKETDPLTANGVYEANTRDILLSGIEVTLYDEDGDVVEMLPGLTYKGTPITNPTLTNEDGEYMFTGLCALKKYYLKYKISSYYTENDIDYLVNGQYLENTIYTQPKVDSFNRDLTSNRATLLTLDRDVYNERFKHIDSAPNNYTGENGANKTYRIFEQTYDVARNEKRDMVDLQKAIIGRIQKYIKDNGKYPNLSEIYDGVIRSNSRISEVGNKVQYLEDIAVTMTTGKGSEIDMYPIRSQFAINDDENTKSTKILGTEYIAIYPGQRHINCGTIEREKFDLNLSKDISEIKVTINEKEHIYTCNARYEEEQEEIEIRGSDVLFEPSKLAKENTDRDGVGEHNAYERDLRECDIRFINYSIDQKDNKNNTVTDDDRLRVFVTYRIRVRNQSNGPITGYVTKLADYYDEDYVYNNTSSIVKYNSEGIESKNDLVWDVEGHKLTTTRDELSNLALNANEYFDIYTEFEVTSEALKKLLEDPNESTKENYAEIMGYETYYTTNRKFKQTQETINEGNYKAGLVDRDSRPGDFEVTDEVKKFVEYTYGETDSFKGYGLSYNDKFKDRGAGERTERSLNIFQDDADKAPGLKLKLLTEIRVLKGNVWEDKALTDKLREYNIRIGDGKMTADEQPIENLRVELIDIRGKTGTPDIRGNPYETESAKFTKAESEGITEGVNIADIYTRKDISSAPVDVEQIGFEPAITYTDANGNYEFTGYVPGDYLVRFIYGEKLLLESTPKGKETFNNEKVYNGQDYKSTVYDEEFYETETKEDGSKRYWYNDLKGLAQSERFSNALDNFKRRNNINEYYMEMDYEKADILNYIQNRKEENLNALERGTRLWADTPKMEMEVEYTQDKADYTRDKYIEYQTYVVENVDFGIVERPRQELTLTKDIENIRFIANDGQTIFDTNQKVTNLAWIKPIKNIVGRYKEDNDINGMVNLTVDENLMHGATIKILYKIIIENTGEKDFVNQDGTIDEQFYKAKDEDIKNYLGEKTPGKLVTNKATLIVDYVENNLKFNTGDTDDNFDNIDRLYTFSKGQNYNAQWERIKGANNKGKTKDGEGEEKFDTILGNKLNSEVLTQAKQFNTIIKIKENTPLVGELKPAEKRVVHGNGKETKDITNVVNIEGDLFDPNEKNTDTYGQYAATNLFLTKVLNTDGKNKEKGDDFKYNNALEIIETQNLAGRRCYNYIDKSKYQEDEAKGDKGADQINDSRMIFSIPGDYDPTLASSREDHVKMVATQADYDYAERVTINVPFGQENYTIMIVVIITSVVVLAIGIIVIKKKVLGKKKNIDSSGK